MLIEYNVEKDFLYQEGVEKGMEQGIEKGIEQGIEKNTKATVLRCLNMGMTIDQIQDITGLSHEEIKKLIP